MVSEHVAVRAPAGVQDFRPVMEFFSSFGRINCIDMMQPTESTARRFFWITFDSTDSALEVLSSRERVRAEGYKCAPMEKEGMALRAPGNWWCPRCKEVRFGHGDVCNACHYCGAVASGADEAGLAPQDARASGLAGAAPGDEDEAWWAWATSVAASWWGEQDMGPESWLRAGKDESSPWPQKGKSKGGVSEIPQYDAYNEDRLWWRSSRPDASLAPYDPYIEDGRRWNRPRARPDAAYDEYAEEALAWRQLKGKGGKGGLMPGYDPYAEDAGPAWRPSKGKGKTMGKAEQESLEPSERKGQGAKGRRSSAGGSRGSKKSEKGGQRDAWIDTVAMEWWLAGHASKTEHAAGDEGASSAT